MNKLSNEQLEILTQKRISENKEHIVEVMNTDELKAYLSNCIEAIERQNERIEKSKGIMKKIAIETKEELEKYITFIDANTKETNLTEKESKVLKAIHSNTYEMGLPVEVVNIKEETGYTKRTIVGVLSSLYKKGYVEKYDMDLDNEFMITEKGFELVEKYLNEN